MPAEYVCPVCGHRLHEPPPDARWGVDDEGRRLPTLVCPVDGYLGRLPDGTVVPVEPIDVV